VQLALPGFTEPAGIGALDCRLSDRIADLDHASVPGAPVPVFMEGSVFPLLPAAPTRLMLTRQQFGIGENVPVFGVFAAAARLSSRCLTTWKALAERVPAALFFVCPLQPADREPVRRLLLAAGIDAAQILSLPAAQSRPRDLAVAGLVDVVLDTMPGSDYFSTRAAIQDAIPLVTMSGRMVEERVALSLLSQLGDCSTVAASGRDYVDIAAQLAVDLHLTPTARAARLDHLQSLLQKSSLDDMAKFVARFEDALFLALDAAGATPERTEPAP
jgi:predicted O-linked N-acetylglucosamine transferase (SPINDLY family)